MSLSVSPAESVVLVGLCSALSIGVVLFQAKLSGELDEVDLGGNVSVCYYTSRSAVAGL